LILSAGRRTMCQTKSKATCKLHIYFFYYLLFYVFCVYVLLCIFYKFKLFYRCSLASHKFVGLAWEKYALKDEYKREKRTGYHMVWLDPPWLILKNRVTCCIFLIHLHYLLCLMCVTDYVCCAVRLEPRYNRMIGWTCLKCHGT
jgi:hypothetical protein